MDFIIADFLNLKKVMPYLEKTNTMEFITTNWVLTKLKISLSLGIMTTPLEIFIQKSLKMSAFSLLPLQSLQVAMPWEFWIYQTGKIRLNG